MPTRFRAPRRTTPIGGDGASRSRGGADHIDGGPDRHCELCKLIAAVDVDSPRRPDRGMLPATSSSSSRRSRVRGSRMCLTAIRGHTLSEGPETIPSSCGGGADNLIARAATIRRPSGSVADIGDCGVSFRRGAGTSPRGASSFSGIVRMLSHRQ